jgi:hypothetical protein
MCDMFLLEDLATNVGFDVLKAVSGLDLLVCDVMQFGRFISTYLEDERRRFLQNLWNPSTKPHSITSRRS